MKSADCYHNSALCFFVRHHNNLCSLITQARPRYLLFILSPQHLRRV